MDVLMILIAAAMFGLLAGVVKFSAKALNSSER